MRLRYNFAIMEMDGEIAAVPVGDNCNEFHGMLKINDVSAEILRLLSEDTTPEKVLEALLNKYPEATDQEVGEQLAAFLNKLIAEGLLIDQ